MRTPILDEEGLCSGSALMRSLSPTPPRGSSAVLSMSSSSCGHSGGRGLWSSLCS